MNNIPEKETTNIIPALLSFLGTPIVSTFFTLLTKPFSEKTKIDLLRKNLLATIRFRMATSIAECLPEKEIETPYDDYLEICKAKLNDYFGSNQSITSDLLISEVVYRSYVKYFKYFKYGIVLIPVLTILLSIVLFVFCREILTLKNCGVAVTLSVLLLVALWVLKEHKRDKYSDLCSQYEVVVE